MGEAQSGTGESALFDRAALTATVPPSGLPERADLRDRLAATLAAPLDSAGSAAAVLYGPPGSGKTAILRSLTDDRVPAAGTTCWLTCTPRDSVYTLAARVARHFGADVPASGVGLETVRSRALAAAADRAGPLVLVLDDLGALDGDVRRPFVTDVVAALRDDDVAVLAAADDVALRNEFADAEKSILCDRELAVGPYDESQLRAIVDRRVEAAFPEDAVGDRVVEAATDYAAAEGRSLADALELLALAGEDARAAGRTTVERVDLAAAMERLTTRRLAGVVETLPDHERFALRGLADLGRDDALPARVGAAYSAYVAVCERVGVEPNTERSLQNYLSSLTDTELAGSEQVRTDRGGQYYRYDLLVDADRIVDAVDALSD